MANVLYTYDGKLISDTNPLPVKVAGGVDEEVLEDYYTKKESDDKFQVKGSFATTAQVNSKADQADLTALEGLVANLQAEVEALKGDEEEEV